MKLYELGPQFVELQAILEEVDPNDVDLQVMLKDTLESIEGEIEIKFENMAKMQKQFEAEAFAIGIERKRLQERENAAKNKADNIKSFMDHWLKALGYNGENKKKLQAGVFKLGVQKNNPSLKYDYDKLWKEVPAFFRTPLPDKVDNVAFLKYLKENEAFRKHYDTKGFKIEQGESIRIK